MLHGTSTLNFVGAGFYLTVATLCCFAFATASSSHQQPTQRKIWLGMTMFFCALIASRLLGFEDWLRGEIRELLQSYGLYAGRRSWQALLVAGVALLGLTMAGISVFWSLRRQSHRANGRREMAILIAQIGTCAMALLISLRLVSLHSVDAWLYGSWKLNWFFDLGSAATVGACAILYTRAVRTPERR